MAGQIIGYTVLAAFALFVVILVTRALLLKKPQKEDSDYKPRDIDAGAVAEKLAGAVRIRTVTLPDNDSGGSVFYEYQAYLEKTFPLIAYVAEKTIVNKYAVIYKVKGTDDSLLPAAILAHQDVVPADPEGWECDPFGGEIRSGYVYGRGSQDMKSQMIAALEGLEILLKEGKVLRRTLLFCFGHDEELRGTYGAYEISKHLESLGVRLEYVIDEGGTILDGKLLGIDNKIALIGTCEKGYADYILEVAKDGGHASAPTPRTAVGMLAEAIYKVEKHKMRPFWTKPTKEMFAALAPYMNFGFKLALANRDILSPLMKPLLCVVSPFTNCLMRTTLAPTQAEGASTPNTLPGVARGTINARINTGESVESVQAHIQKVVGKKVRITTLEGSIDPSPVSDTSSEAYAKLKKTIGEVFSGYIVAPYPFIAASDAKHYYNLTDNVYRFTPFEKSVEDANRIHGLNERQDIAMLAQGTQFFLRLYENTCL